MKFRLVYLMRFEQTVDAPDLQKAAEAMRSFAGLHKFGTVIPLSVLAEGAEIEVVTAGGKKR